MRKIPSASAIGDKLHRGFVWVCLGLTAYGFVIGGSRFYHYLNVTRPTRQAVKDNLLEEELPHRSAVDPEELKS